MEGAWKVHGRCTEGAREVSGRYNANDLIGCGGDRRCVKGVREVHRRCAEGVWEVCGRCMEAVQKVCGRCMEGAWEVLGRCVEGVF